MFKTKKARAIAIVACMVAVVSLFVGTISKMTWKGNVASNLTATAGNIELETKLVEPGKDTEDMSEAYKKSLFENLYAGAGDPDYLEEGDTRYDCDVLIKNTGSLSPDFVLYLSGSFLDDYDATNEKLMAFYDRLRIRVKEMQVPTGLKLKSIVPADGITFKELYAKKETHNDSTTTTKLYVPIAHFEAIPNVEVADTNCKIRLHFSVDDIDKGVYDFAQLSDWSGTSVDDLAQSQSIKFDFDVKAMANPRHQVKETGKDETTTTPEVPGGGGSETGGTTEGGEETPDTPDAP